MRHPFYSLMVLGLFLLLSGQDEIGTSRAIENSATLNYKRFSRLHFQAFDNRRCSCPEAARDSSYTGNFIDFTIGFAHSGMSVKSYEYARIHGAVPIPACAGADWRPDDLTQCRPNRQVWDKVLDLMMNWPISRPSQPEKILGRFVNPLHKPICTCGFCYGAHLGMDLCAPLKTPIVAAASGRVIYAGFIKSYDGYGKIVLVDHGQGILSLYGHIEPLARFVIPEKSLGKPLFVNAGEQIGVVGPPHAGEATSGPHLHFELLSIWREDGRIKSALLNPANYLPAFKDDKQNSSGEAKVRALYRKPWLNADLGRGSWSLVQTLQSRHPEVVIKIPFRKDPLVKTVSASHSVKKFYPQKDLTKNYSVHQEHGLPSHQHNQSEQAIATFQHGWMP